MNSKYGISECNKRLEKALSNLKKHSKISSKNKKIIYEFHNYCFAEGLSVARIIKYVYTLKSIALRLNKNFEIVTKKDILELVRNIEKSDFADWTKRDYKVALKKFYKWLRNSETYPKEVSWIKSKRKNGNHKLPEELLTEEDIIKLINTAKHPRDKALVAILYESGCRIGELSSLRLKNIQFDEYGCRLIVNGKTGMRRVMIISSAPYLASWISIHPNKKLDSPLWVDRTRGKNEFLRYGAIRMLFKRLAKKAGVDKRVNLHAFRHARATYLAKYLTEAQMKEYFGWVQSSDMASVYVHLSGRDVDDALLKLHGIKNEEKKEESVLKPKKCSRCETLNPATGKFCNKCGLPLDVKTAIELEEKRGNANEIMNVLIKEPDVQRLLLEKIKKLGLLNKITGGKK